MLELTEWLVLSIHSFHKDRRAQIECVKRYSFRSPVPVMLYIHIRAPPFFYRTRTLSLVSEIVEANRTGYK